MPPQPHDKIRQMIAAFDVHYREDGRASAAAVCFRHYPDAVPVREYVALMDVTSPYIPGQFYRRELPCILALLDQFRHLTCEMVIDGYVMLGDRPGLGRLSLRRFLGHNTGHRCGKIEVPGFDTAEGVEGREQQAALYHVCRYRC